MDRYPGPSPEEEQAARCLTGCLSQVTPNNRNLILRYYQGERQNRIQNRQTMAKEFGIPLNALRNRALRLRAKLEECVLRCTERNRGEMFSRVSSQRE
jgi:DNA-directed RNA polymerase specialized sigma24 family protein